MEDTMLKAVAGKRRGIWHAGWMAGSILALVLSSSAAAATFGPPVIVTSQSLSEPGVAVSPNGKIFVDAPAGLLSSLPGSASPIFRSDDGGLTFNQTPAGLRANFPGGGDSNIAIDPVNGTLYFTDLWLGSSTVSVSSDNAQTWLANPIEGVIVQDRQWLATPGGGIAYHVTHQIPAGIVVSKSSGGLVYPISTIAATPLDQTGCVCPPGNLIAEAGGAMLGTSDKVGVIYSTSSGGVNFAHSSNGALTFTNTAVTPANGAADTTTAFPVVANAGGGHLDATWLEVIGATSRIQFASSSDWGGTWSTPVTLVSSGASVYPWIAASGGKVAVSLFHTTSAGTADTAPPSAQWFESYLESTDGGTTFSPLQTVDPTVVKTGPICTGGTNCTANRELGDFQSDTLDGSGHALLTWTHSIDNKSKTEVRLVKEG
jgi:hypothetical protein